MLLKIGDMSTLRIENENWIKKGFKFEVVLFKKNMLSNCKSVWEIDMQKTMCSSDDNRKQIWFVRDVQFVLKLSGVNAVICSISSGYKFYPASEGFLSRKVSDSYFKLVK